MKELIEKMMDEVNNAQQKLNYFSQDHIDKIIGRMAKEIKSNSASLAQMAVEDTGMGVVEDKIQKNLFVAEHVYESIKNKKTVGIIREDGNFIEIATPVGTILAITPTTNPTSTVLFKAMIAMKSRNTIVFSFHPRAKECSRKAFELMYTTALQAGAPEGCMQYIHSSGLNVTTQLMAHPDIKMILATGGSSMVKAAYSSGKPALGVGAGNVPVYIEKSAEVASAVLNIRTSKTFDNGLICASEQAVVVDECISNEVITTMENNGYCFLNSSDTEKLQALVINSQTNTINTGIIGKNATRIATMAGIQVPDAIKVLVVKPEGIGYAYPFSREKLSPILAFYTAKDYISGIEMCQRLTDCGGHGHTAVVYSNDKNIIKNFAENIQTSRILVNTPSSQGAIGGIYNSLDPSLTLGCGTFGNNSTTRNISALNLINIKRVAFSSAA